MYIKESMLRFDYGVHYKTLNSAFYFDTKQFNHHGYDNNYLFELTFFFIR